jgi:hypothetical protein
MATHADHMAIQADHEERLVHLHALYEQGYVQNEFSECIKQCEHSLREYAGMALFWRIKTYCILTGACQHDWHRAEASKSPSQRLNIP